MYQLVKIKGYTLQGAQEVIKGDHQKVFDKVAMVDRLHQIKSFLIEIRDTMHVEAK